MKSFHWRHVTVSIRCVNVHCKVWKLSTLCYQLTQVHPKQFYLRNLHLQEQSLLETLHQSLPNWVIGTALYFIIQSLLNWVIETTYMLHFSFFQSIMWGVFPFDKHASAVCNISDHDCSHMLLLVRHTGWRPYCLVSCHLTDSQLSSNLFQ